MPVLDGYPEDLRAFGLLACRMLRVQTDFKVGIPLEVAVELEDIEALRALLEAALHGDPERHYPSWAEVRKALRSALFGQTGAKAMVRTEAFATHPGLAADGAPGAAGGDDADPPPPGRLGRPSRGDRAPCAASAGRARSEAGDDAPHAAAASRSAPTGRDAERDDAPELPLGRRPDRAAAAAAGGRSRQHRDGAGAGAALRRPAAERHRADSRSLETSPCRRRMPPPPPARKLPKTTEIPAARVPPPAAPKRPAPPPPPEELASTLEIPRAVVQDVMARPAPAPRHRRRSRLRRLPPPPLTPRCRPRPPAPVPAPASRAAAPCPPRAAAGPGRAGRGRSGHHRPSAGGAGRPRRGAAPAPAPADRRCGRRRPPAGVGLALAWFLRRTPEPPPKPKIVAKPVAPPPVVTPPPAPAPLPVHPQLALAQTSLGAGDFKGVKTALDAITPADQAAFRPDEKDLYQRLTDSLTPLKREELASNLARALERGDLRQLRSLADAVPAADQAALPPEVQANLARARKIVDLDSKLTRAVRTGNALEVIHQADALLAELPPVQPRERTEGARRRLDRDRRGLRDRSRAVRRGAQPAERPEAGVARPRRLAGAPRPHRHRAQGGSGPGVPARRRLRRGALQPAARGAEAAGGREAHPALRGALPGGAPAGGRRRSPSSTANRP